MGDFSANVPSIFRSWLCLGRRLHDGGGGVGDEDLMLRLYPVLRMTKVRMRVRIVEGCHIVVSAQKRDGEKGENASRGQRSEDRKIGYWVSEVVEVRNSTKASCDEEILSAKRLCTK